LSASVKDGRLPPFVWQSRAALRTIRHCFDKQERTYAIAIYHAMTEIANDQRHMDSFTASRAEIALLAGVSDRTIDRYVETFERVGLLQVERQTSDGVPQPSTYTLLDGGEGASPPPPEGASPGVAKEVRQGGEGASPSMETVQEEQQEGEEELGATAPPPLEDGQLFGTPGSAERKPGGKLSDEEERKLQIVWQHWLTVFGHRMKVKGLTDPRRRDLVKALKATGWDTDICCRAIDGLKIWRESGHKGAMELSTIFSTHPGSKSNLTDQIEWWSTQANATVPKDDGGSKIPLDLSGVPSVTAGSIRGRRREVVAMVQHPDDAEAKERGEVALTWLQENCGHSFRQKADSSVEWIWHE
jgi:hypothetical protein